MAHNCDYYRDRAIVEGMDSLSAREWRSHSRHCRACAMEIHILDSLCEQAMDRRQHIPRRDFDTLAETVRQLYQPAPARSWSQGIWALSWKFAALFVFLAAGYYYHTPLQATYQHLTRTVFQPEPAILSTAVPPPAEPFSSTFSAGADQGRFLASPGPAEPPPTAPEFSEYDYLFAPPNHYELDADLRNLRESVSGQIDSLEGLIESDLNGEF